MSSSWTCTAWIRPIIATWLFRSYCAGSWKPRTLYTQAPPDEKPKTVIIIEEAHEFVSGRRLQQMPSLSEQIHRIARRGRKRWLGLMFATQFPQHLPDELFTLCNNRILMKL